MKLLFSPVSKHDIAPAAMRGLAWLSTFLVMLIIVLSAFIRLARAAPAQLADWPAQALELARIGHRASASATLIIVLLMIALAMRHAALARLRAQVAAVFALVVFLAVLGASTGASAMPGVILGNLLGGFALFACCLRLARSSGAGLRPWPAGLAPKLWLGIAIALVLLQIALGGLVSAGHAGLSCPATGICRLHPGGWQAFMLWLTPDQALAPDHPQGALVHAAHRFSGLALALVLALLAWHWWRMRRRAVACAFLALPLASIAVGLGLVANELPISLILLHNFLAALLLGLLACQYPGAPPGGGEQPHQAPAP